jgi:hypothetical protein
MDFESYPVVSKMGASPERVSQFQTEEDFPTFDDMVGASSNRVEQGKR